MDAPAIISVGSDGHSSPSSVCGAVLWVYCTEKTVRTRFSGKYGPNTQTIVDNYLDVPIENCRTFSIIAHIDHGKSTLADAIMKRAGNIPDNAPSQFLDNLEVERERGITVKAQTASMLVRNSKDHENYLLNLIDTPGHVDFSYEVEKSLAACQGVLMLVDSTQGIQAQTLSTFHSAQKHVAVASLFSLESRYHSSDHEDRPAAQRRIPLQAADHGDYEGEGDGHSVLQREEGHRLLPLSR